MREVTLEVPETLEGWAVLHQIYSVDWKSWRSISPKTQAEALSKAENYLSKIAKPASGGSACYSVLGHKGDLLFLHFRKTLDELNEIELGLNQLEWASHLRPTQSYLSFLELGMYEMTVKIHQELLAQGLKPDSEEWQKGLSVKIAEQKERMMNRLFPSIPDDRYLCFYPMDKRRGEQANWYMTPMDKRQTMMRDHGMIGRKYGGRVTQVITGSIGYDDWEWGVYLFAKDPVVYKKLIYEMRFDEASAMYGLFGPFYVGLRYSPEDLTKLMNGELPAR